MTVGPDLVTNVNEVEGGAPVKDMHYRALLALGVSAQGGAAYGRPENGGHTMPNGGGVEITLRDLYDLLMTLTGQVQVSLSQGEANRAMLSDHETRIRELEMTAAGAKETGRIAVDHEVRMRDVERWRRALPVTLVVSLGSLAAAAISVFK